MRKLAQSFYTIIIITTAILQQTCSAQYLLGHAEPADNYIFQILINEEEGAKEIFKECEKVKTGQITLSADDKAYIKDRHNYNVKEDLFKVYAGYKGSKVVKYAVVTDCQGCFRPITLMMSIDPNGWINDLNVMIYRESRGGDVTNERFLGQFEGKTIDTLDNIDMNVTGATSSARCLINGAREGLLVLKEFIINKGFSGKHDDFVAHNKGKTKPTGPLILYTQTRWIANKQAIIAIWERSEQRAANVTKQVFKKMRDVQETIHSDARKLNKKGKKKFYEYSEEFVELIALCKEYSRKTNGIFNITISNDNGNHSSDAIIIKEKRIAFGDKDIKINISSIKDSYMVDNGFKVLAENGINIAAINYGDNTRVTGKPPNEGTWPIGIRYLDEKDRIMGYIKITNGAVSILTNPYYHKLSTIRQNNDIVGNVSTKQWAALAYADSSLAASVFAGIIFTTGGEGNLRSTIDMNDIEYGIITDNAEGTLSSKVSDGLKNRFFRMAGTVTDYGKVPVCACQ